MAFLQVAFPEEVDDQEASQEVEGQEGIQDEEQIQVGILLVLAEGVRLVGAFHVVKVLEVETVLGWLQGNHEYQQYSLNIKSDCFYLLINF